MSATIEGKIRSVIQHDMDDFEAAFAPDSNPKIDFWIPITKEQFHGLRFDQKTTLIVDIQV